VPGDGPWFTGPPGTGRPAVSRTVPRSIVGADAGPGTCDQALWTAAAAAAPMSAACSDWAMIVRSERARATAAQDR
jgi:hypothetical protein